MKRIATIVLILAAALSAAIAIAAPTDTIGPVHVEPACTVYILSDGSPCKVRVTYEPYAVGWNRHAGEQILTRLYAPDEEPAFWKYDETQDKGAYPIVHETELAAQEGVHQLRLLAGAGNSTARIVFSRAVAFGVTGQCGVFNPWNPSQKQAWAWAPGNAEFIEVQGGPVEVSAGSGKALLSAAKGSKKARADVTPRSLLKVAFPQPADWSFRMRGFPFILCDSPETAKTIQASTIELPGGQVVYHQFQADMLAMLPQLLKPENIGRSEELIKPLDENMEAWLADPIRNNLLLGTWAPMQHIPWILREQVVDPKSPIGGSVIDPSKPPKPGKLPSAKAVGGILAFAATLDEPFNPYRGRAELYYRAAAACFRDFMRLGEDETFQDDPAGNMNDYPTGILHFPLAHCHSVPYSYAARHMPDDVRALWTKALRRPTDRLFPIRMVTCRNQSSHGMMILEHIFQGSGDATYQRMAALYAKRFAEEMNVDSYDMERCGPDASYQGMTDYHKGYYYRMSGNEDMRESLRKSYYFYNHTVAPEPDGTPLGSVNFSHRTPSTFAREQYNGARDMCSDVMPEIGVWTPTPTEDDIAKARDIVKRQLETPFTEEEYKKGSPRVVGRYSGQLSIPHYLWHSNQPAKGLFPAQEAGPFVRHLGGELVAVKRPAYYAAAYVGSPAAEYYIRTRHALRKPLPDNQEDRDDIVPKNTVTPFTGGGLSVFWTPEYGNALLAANWTPRTHHGLLVRKADSTRWWEDYLNFAYQLDEKAGVLIIQGRIEEQPIEYTRTMRFGDEALEMEVVLKAGADIDAAGIVEIVPFVHGEKKSAGMKLDLPEKGKTFAMFDKKGNGVRYTFAQERAFQAVYSKYRAKYEHCVGRVEVGLPAKLQSGQTVTLKYEIRPIRAADTQ